MEINQTPLLISEGELGQNLSQLGHISSRRFHDREDRLDREAIAYDRNDRGDRVIANDREAKAIESEQPFPGTKHKH